MLQEPQVYEDVDAVDHANTQMVSFRHGTVFDNLFE